MKRWLVKLDGNPEDLEEFPRWFPDGDVYALAEGKEVYLTGPYFDISEYPAQARDAATQVLDEFVGIISLLWPSLRRPSIGDVYFEDVSGVRSRHLFASITEALRLKDRVSAELEGGAPRPPGLTDAQQLLLATRSAHRAQVAVMLWSDPHRSWPRLYRILEELELQLGEKVHITGLCSDKERERFTRSANSAEIAGGDARHAGGRYQPPKNPMALQEASAFVASLIQATLRRVYTEQNNNPAP